MVITLEELTRENFPEACEIDRDDVPEDFVDTAATLMELTEYGVEHRCIGHTFLARLDGKCIGTILLGEAIPWETDPPQVKSEPFFRLMGFIIDKAYRKKGFGGKILEETVRRLYLEYGPRPVVLGCHRDNEKAARFYERHGFVKTEYTEGNDIYYLRYPEK